ncbi:MAG: PhoH family protein [Candidatus Bipolaricaulota bacterium]|nr:MAG: PhoH family protein [Candidatus Bipolaricaulota bacterium]
MSDAQATIRLRDNAISTAVLGKNHGNLKAIQRAFPARVVARGDTVRIEGTSEDVERVRTLFEKLLDLAEDNHVPSPDEVSYLISRVAHGEGVDRVLSDVVRVTHWGEEIRAKTAGQHRYIEAIRENDIVFSIGPAGTGKTYLAVATAIDYLKTERVKRIILTRPAVEAGEELGFLPGDIQAKVSPYLRPLYDAIFDMIPAGEFERLMEHGRIELAPLAFMRGRTLNNSFVILDEAQNTTSIQMKMFLTRLGFHSKAIITGDITQVDLQIGRSGLKAVQEILVGIEGISFVNLTRADVVRHPLVAQIVDAYDRHEAQREELAEESESAEDAEPAEEAAP